MEAIGFIILRIFFTPHVVLKIGEYLWIFHSFSSVGYIQSCDAFRPITQQRKYLMDYKVGYLLSVTGSKQFSKTAAQGKL